MDALKDFIANGLCEIPKKEYRVAKTVVTAGLWKEVVGKLPMKGHEERGDAYPVDGIGFRECWELIEKLNTGKEAKAANLSFGLPTPEEWKYACAGSKKGIGKLSIFDLGWFSQNSEGTIHEVALKAANAFGLYDMAGNVNELCTDGVKRGGAYNIDPIRYGAGINGVSLQASRHYGSKGDGIRLVARESPWEWTESLSSEFRGNLLAEVPDAAVRCNCFSAFDGETWVKILKTQPLLAEYCDWDKLGGYEWCELLSTQPQFADKCDIWDEMSACSWRNILCVLPAMADRFNKWDELDSMDWICLLEEQPSFADRCDKWDEFDESDWERLLEAQPKLEKFKK